MGSVSSIGATFNATGAAVTDDDVIKAALAIMAQRRGVERDSEGIDFQQILEGLAKHMDSGDGAIQVLEGDADKVKIEHFSATNADGILEAVHFIEVNNLQEVRPWSLVWNLYQCLTLAMKG